MEPVHIHLLLNHVPILGSIVGLLLLLYAVIRSSDEVLRIAFIALVLTAVVAIPVFLTGEPAEEVVERLPGVSEALIEQHEDAAKFALWTSIVTGVAAFVALFFSSKLRSAGKYLTWTVMVLSLITAITMGRAGNLGGQVRHTEIRAAGAQNPVQPDNAVADKKNKEGDDDH